MFYALFPKGKTGLKSRVFVCPNCGHEYASHEEFARCPYCGSKVLFKETPPVSHKVSTD